MSSHVGYVALLRCNKPFRRLWYGQVVSQLGDWFDSIALYTILLNLTGSGEAVGALLVAQFLPSAVVSPWAGVFVDRLPRRLVLIGADIGRALLVLLFLLVQRREDIWIIYTVTVLKNVLTSFFEPARSALTPDVAGRDELVAANAISGATWSAMLALGAAAGGLVVGLLGMQAAFLIDSASFGLSALLIASMRVVESHKVRTQASGLQDLQAGLRFIAQRRDVAIYTLIKGLWSIGGGVLVLLTIFGREIFPLGQGGALSIGLLYAARGVGAGIGPILAQRWGGGSTSFLRRAIGPAFLLTGVGYMFVSGAPVLSLTLLAVMLAHMGGSIQWTFGTTLIQMSVPSEFLGRVFAVELACLTLTSAISSYLFGVLHDAGWGARPLAIIGACAFVLPGIALMILLRGRPAEANQVELNHTDTEAQRM